MSRILSRISMFTGQISSHALQDVQAHTSSEVMRSNRLLADTVISGSTPMGGETTGVPVRAMTSPDLSRSEEHTSELQSLMRISYAVFCLNKKKNNNN